MRIPGAIQSFLGVGSSKQNLLAWVVAGTAAYFLYVKPLQNEQKIAQETVERQLERRDTVR